jgi:Clp amino terminal domain, pathogenicity island component
MFDRLSEHARRAIVYAREEAYRLEHNYIGTEHLLLGLIREPQGLPARALAYLGLDVAQLYHRIERDMGRGRSFEGRYKFTPRVHRVLELALREALQLGHNYVGTEHILLGLVREGEGLAARLLREARVDLPRVRGALATLLVGDISSGSLQSPDRVPPSHDPATLLQVIPLVRVVEAPPQEFTLIALDMWTSFTDFRYALTLDPPAGDETLTLTTWRMEDDRGTPYRARSLRMAGRMLPVVFTERFAPAPPPNVRRLSLLLRGDDREGDLLRIDIPLAPR